MLLNGKTARARTSRRSFFARTRCRIRASFADPVAVEEPGGDFVVIGRSLGQYRVTASIGAGGMGEVYRATDARLGRDVAIKVLPADTAAHPDRRQRFEQEARAASALNHPNILTVYDVGEAEGTTYIAMELVDGKSSWRRGSRSRRRGFSTSPCRPPTVSPRPMRPGSCTGI